MAEGFNVRRETPDSDLVRVGSLLLNESELCTTKTDQVQLGRNEYNSGENVYSQKKLPAGRGGASTSTGAAVEEKEEKSAATFDLDKDATRLTRSHRTKLQEKCRRSPCTRR